MNLRKALHAGLAFLVLAAIAAFPWRGLNRAWQDSLARIPAHSQRSGKVFVLGIDDEAITRLGPWPWNRALTARLFDALRSAGPAVVAFDGYFPHRAIAESGDTALRASFAALRESGTSLILPFQFSDLSSRPAAGLAPVAPPATVQTSSFQLLSDRPTLERSPFMTAERILLGDDMYQELSAPSGHIASSADPQDGVYRQMLHVVRLGDEFYPSLTVAALAAYRKASLAEVSLAPGVIRVSDLDIPIDRNGFAPLAWLGGKGTVPTIPAGEFLANPQAFADRMRGGIVFVGVTSSAALSKEIGDFFRTPVADKFPGVELWGVAVENILARRVPTRPGWLRLLEFAFGASAAWVSWRLLARRGPSAPVFAGAGGIAVGGIVVLLAFHLLAQYRTAIDLPLVGLALGLAGAWAWKPSRPASLAPVATFLPGEATGAPMGGLVLPGASQPASPAAPADDGKQRIGRYEILSELGRGAMGIVYKAFDPRIKRELAIKVIAGAQQLTASHSAQFDRFAREAEAIGALSHPNIVTIYDFGDHEGSSYLAMEFVRGTPLDKVLESGRSPTWAHVRAWGQQVLDGLAYAHGRGVIHRDIKPSNLMLLADNRTVKLMDFGLARLNDSSLTQEGSVLGTPFYMSPEQVDGRQVDARCDQFSTGVMLYELLTGEKPFMGDDIRAIMLAILLRPHPDLPSRVRPGTPEGAVDIVERLLAKDPNERFATTAAAAEAWRALG